VIAAFLEKVFTGFPWTRHYITNVEIDLDGDTASVRASYNPMQLPGFAEPSFCGGPYEHAMVGKANAWKSRRLVEHDRWLLNPPGAPPSSVA